VTRFSFKPAPDGDELLLLAGSAPWTEEQFHTKGVDALLDVAQRMPLLKLVLLWRGWLLEELRRRIADRGLADRVEVLTERVDVNEILGRVHAAVVLAEEPNLVKAFPHSLLEALAAGKPVVVSEGIALADHVERTECGQTVKGVDPEGLANAIARLEQDYPRLQANALDVGRRDFSLERLVGDYRGVYEAALSRDTRRV
jgi:glycosyltransferase involved in cell wall biosynthesis